MSAARLPEKDEPPLDPAVARVQARLRTMMLIAGLTLGLGFLAVLFAVVYRIATLDDSAEPSIGEVPAMVDLEGAALPPGAELVSTALDGNRLAVTFRTESGFVIVVLDVRDMSILSRAELLAPSPSP